MPRTNEQAEDRVAAKEKPESGDPAGDKEAPKEGSPSAELAGDKHATGADSDVRPWREVKKQAKSAWMVPLLWLNWYSGRVANQLSQLKVLKVFEAAGKLSVVVGVVTYIGECDKRKEAAADQRKQKHYQAWQAIDLARGQKGDAGRSDALRDLHKDGVSLAGVDLSSARLPDLDLSSAMLYEARLKDANFERGDFTGANLTSASLENGRFDHARFNDSDLRYATMTGVVLTGASLQRADLRNANLEGADLQYADLKFAKLEGARLAGATLQGAHLDGVSGWQKLDIAGANVYVADAPDGFKEAALARGAVSLEHDAEWRHYRSSGSGPSLNGAVKPTTQIVAEAVKFAPQSRLKTPTTTIGIATRPAIGSQPVPNTTRSTK